MIDLDICVGSSCHLKGSYKVIRALEKLISEASLENEVEMKAQFCMQQCQNAVSVSFDGKFYSVSPDTAEAFFEDVVIKKAAHPDGARLKAK